MEFQTPTDIANRALQHCGAELMDATAGFTEISKSARQVSFVYGKLRRAELRRNVWRFATRKTPLRAIDVNTMLLTPALWVSTATYFVGSIVSDASNTLWISRIPNNLGNDPQNTPAWEPYFGPMTAALYVANTSYAAGEIVYTTPGDGTARVFLSLQSANADNPATATAYAATSVYSKNQVVTYLSVAYMSLIDLNTANTPSLAPAAWASGTTYAATNKVTGSDGIIYQSIGSGNIGFDPTTDLGAHWTNTGVLSPWTTVFTGGSGSAKWLEIGGAEFPNGVGVATMNIVYPLGSGPSTQGIARNVYRLPAGYLRTAPQDPKTPGLAYLDWEYEADYMISSGGDPLIFRFVADMQDVTRMDDMFCEGLAARIAMEVCEPLTQSTAKLAAITGGYNKMMGEARTVNGIETGAVEPPVDDYIACRA